MVRWTFLSNHGRALLCIARDPGARLRDVASDLGITERRAYGIVNDLAESGYILKSKEGRRNRYEVRAHLPLPESTPSQRTLGEVLELLSGSGPAGLVVQTAGSSSYRRSGSGSGMANRSFRRMAGQHTRGSQRAEHDSHWERVSSRRSSNASKEISNSSRLRSSLSRGRSRATLGLPLRSTRPS